MDDGERSGLLVGMEAAEGAKQGMDGVFPVKAEGQAMVVDIEVDVLAHDGLVHFPGVGLYEVGEGGVVGECVFEAFANEAVDFGGEGGLIVAEDDTAEGDGCTGFFLPEFTQVEKFGQAFFLVGEPVLVDDHATVDFAGEHSVLDLGKDHELLVAGCREGEGKEQVCRGPFAGDGCFCGVDIGQG